MGVQISIFDSIVQAMRLPEQRIEQELRRELAVALYTQDILFEELDDDLSYACGE